MTLQVLVTYVAAGTYTWNAMDTGNTIQSGTATTLTAAGAAAKTALISYANTQGTGFITAGTNIQ